MKRLFAAIVFILCAGQAFAQGANPSSPPYRSPLNGAEAVAVLPSGPGFGAVYTQVQDIVNLALLQALTSGVTPINGSCGNGFLLFNNAGVLGCEAGGGEAPSGPAGGVLAGTYPNPSAVHITPFSTPSFVDLAQYLTDMGSLRAFGYVGDGSSHALSTVTSFNGQNSTGWTLTQWQAVLPAATALSDEIDGVAVQSMINSGRPVPVPPGTGLVSHTLVVPCAQQLTMVGQGPQVSTLQFLGSGDGIDICVGQQAVNQRTLMLAGVELDCNNAACGFALNANLWVPQQFHIVENIGINPVSGHQWANGLKFTNASRLEIKRVSLSGTFSPSPTNSVGVGITLATATNAGASQQGAFATNIENSEVYGWGTCVASNSTTDNGVEGVVMDKLNCDASNNFFEHTNTNAATYQTPLYVVTNSQIHIWKQVIGAQGIGSVFFNDNLIYIDPPGPGAGVDMFSLDDIQLAEFHHNNIFPTLAGPFGTNITYNSIYNLKNTHVAPNNITFDHDIINNGFGASTVTTAGMVIPSNALVINETNTTWNAWGSTGKPEISNLSTNPSVSFNSIANGVPSITCNGTGTPTINTSSDGHSGQFTTNTGATSCTITWGTLGAVARAATPFCTGSLATSVVNASFSATATTLVVGFASATGGGVFGNWNCSGFR